MTTSRSVSAIAAGLLLAVPALAGSIPEIACIAALRQARIAEMSADLDRAEAALLSAAEPCEQGPASFELVLFAGRHARTGEHVEAARVALVGALEQGDLPLELVDRLESAAPADSPLLVAAARGLAGRTDQAALDVRARIERHLGDSAAAAASLAALAKVDSAVEVRVEQLEVALSRGDWIGALDAFDALQLEPTLSDTLKWRRVALLAEVGRIDEALAAVETLTAAEGEYDTAISLATGTSHVSELMVLAFAARDRGRHDDAKRTFELASLRSPDAEAPRKARLAYYGTASERAADEARAAAARAEIEDPDELFTAGTELLLAGDPTAALPLLAAAAAARPLDPLFWRNYVLCAQRLEDWATVVEAARHAAAIEPGNAEMRRQLGRALLALDRCEEALAPLQEAIAIEPGEPGNHYDLARCLAALGRMQETQREVAAGKALEQKSGG